MAKAGILFVGTARGVEVWSDPGGSGRWRRRIDALPDTAVDSVTVSDALHVQVTCDGRSYRSTDGGLSWEAGTAGEDAVSSPNGRQPRQERRLP